ncbi:reverse transcriptase-like protein [Elysia marginata]|uniref:Reverse transcriptase-like protein n=1 Tax=Elysia marginata TaxID=1093978 RepID=A0AAV4HEV9_9GAST|nr:reverse transcriptase-like protein [Elysia marginata]
MTKLIKEKNREFYSIVFSNIKTCRGLFYVSNQLLGKNTESACPDGDPKEMCNKFQTFFQEKIAKIRNKLDNDKAPSTTFSPFNGDTLQLLKEVTEKEVKDIIRQSPAKSCALDPIPTNILMTCLDDVLPHITTIINNSLRTGEVPTCFKNAIVKPIITKTGLDENDLTNYRPVSNLPFLSKILEKVVLTQLFGHINTNGLTEAFQSAYKACHSTKTATIRIANDILIEIDARNVCILALLDLSAAFDTLDHEILLKKLEIAFGVTGSALSCFCSYIADRAQKVSLKGETSEGDTIMRFGVSQGSVLWASDLHALHATVG